MRRRLTWALLALLAVPPLVLLLIDWLAPVDLQPRAGATLVVDHQGEPLRRFADERGVWRYPTTIEQVSDNYLQALLTYEDRWFYQHPGVNPLALVRAAGQFLRHGEIISGGSTLTMQVARLRYPQQRGLWGKLVQMVRAVQIDWHFSKRDILTYYLNHAPFGGPIEGVETASRHYFGHSARWLTDAQAALLAGLPQAPSWYHPRRHPERALQQRNKVLQRLATFGQLTNEQLQQALQEPISLAEVSTPLKAPILARRLRQSYPQQGRIQTYIDAELQHALASLASEARQRLPAGASVAILVVEHGSGAVKAYVGSAKFGDRSRFGHVDMVSALRSPGSTLKPFIYALAMDKGLIHSDSLLMDVPLPFGDYRPENFLHGFSGPVSVRHALQRSLNIPAVQVLEQLGPASFYADLHTAGTELQLPVGAGPSLALALGGVATSLQELVQLYTALGNGGQVLPLRLSDADTNLHRPRPLLSPASAWITRQLLLDRQQPGLAVKTGTSSGLQDTWAVASTVSHTLGVWVGQPDNANMSGHHGSATALPLLRAAARLLPRSEQRWHDKPDNVSRQTICWPSGQQRAAELCDEALDAWLIDGQQPRSWHHTRTLTSQDNRSERTLRVASDSGLRLGLGCELPARSKTVAIWPAPLQPWLPPDWQTKNRIAAIDPRCQRQQALLQAEPLRITGLADGSHIRRHASTQQQPTLRVRAVGGQPDWYWFLNGRLLDERGQTLTLPLPSAGRYQISVSDQAGSSDQISFVVEAS
ncbi:penicillin-binding protein 1C [Bacterioplanes sanyensis]|uniref:penicillin-binding protein 1C n=1 Tax=Bacterioplanes sanyensis TaxID=1249553 RepID=UPI00167B7E7F|nr:penicillin-binding protein 1C [Bacterioplanes sanyensis]GGY51264.1 penicillin-binding protein 1C [Bacterioplanes sanyensis]